jgi:hypothetical protein
LFTGQSSVTWHRPSTSDAKDFSPRFNWFFLAIKIALASMRFVDQPRRRNWTFAENEGAT